MKVQTSSAHEFQPVSEKIQFAVEAKALQYTGLIYQIKWLFLLLNGYNVITFLSNFAADCCSCVPPSCVQCQRSKCAAVILFFFFSNNEKDLILLSGHTTSISLYNIFPHILATFSPGGCQVPKGWIETS